MPLWKEYNQSGFKELKQPWGLVINCLQFWQHPVVRGEFLFGIKLVQIIFLYQTEGFLRELAHHRLQRNLLKYLYLYKCKNTGILLEQ